jgi:glycosyltransferase involved in cell wall biosynthesis
MLEQVFGVRPPARRGEQRVADAAVLREAVPLLRVAFFPNRRSHRTFRRGPRARLARRQRDDLDQAGRGRRAVVTIHSTEYGRCGNQFYGGRSAAIRGIERSSTYWADRVITVSHALQKEVAWMYEVPWWKMSVIYNGIQPQHYDGWLDPFAIKREYHMGPMDPMV